MTHSPSSAQSDLLPCPFCGPGESVIDLWHDDVAHRWRVGCGRCGCSTGIHPRDKSQEPAITAWNRRAAASAHTIGEDAAEQAHAPMAAPVPVYPQGVMGIPPYSPPGSGSITVETGLSWNTAPQQPAQPLEAQTLALTDEQRGAISRAVDWCHAMAYEADEKELRALLREAESSG